LATSSALIDLRAWSKDRGSGFILYRGLGARLCGADEHDDRPACREHGYEELWVPVVVNRASMTATGQLPKFEDDMYAIRDEDLFLIPTAKFR
jgi:seryl-tRNA synthetase